LRGRLFYASFF